MQHEVYTTDTAIQRIQELYGDKYDLSRVQVSTEEALTSTSIEIKCKTHGWVKVNWSKLIDGAGCPQCRSRSRGESIIKHLLDKHSIEYEEQVTAAGCTYQSDLYFDFYIPHIPCYIEYQGGQHYFPVERFGGEATFRKVQIRDRTKRSYCKEQKIKLYEIRYDEDISTQMEEILCILQQKTQTQGAIA